MRLFLTYLWVGGALLYTLNTIAYTYLAGPARETIVSHPLKIENAPPRKVASWASHLPTGNLENSAVGEPASNETLQPLGKANKPVPASPLPRTTGIEEKSAGATDDLDLDVKVRGTGTGETVARVHSADTEATSKAIRVNEVGPFAPEDSDRTPVATKTEADERTVAAREESAPASASLQKAIPYERRQVNAPVEMTPSVKPRFPKLRQRKAERAGLGLFRFGPAGF